MKYKNQKAFTLIELLAVIVILGVIMVIAIPSVTQYITNSRKDAYVDTAKALIRAVSTASIDGTYPLPQHKNEVTIVSISMIELDGGKGEKSPFGNAWRANKTYVAIINVGEASDPKYEYYFAGQDTKNYAIPLTREDKISRASILNNARNTMEVTIQSLAGSSSGTLEEHDFISGLKKEESEPWKVTIFSDLARIK